MTYTELATETKQTKTHTQCTVTPRIDKRINYLKSMPKYLISIFELFTVVLTVCIRTDSALDTRASPGRFHLVIYILEENVWFILRLCSTYVYVIYAM